MSINCPYCRTEFTPDDTADDIINRIRCPECHRLFLVADDTGAEMPDPESRGARPQPATTETELDDLPPTIRRELRSRQPSSRSPWTTAAWAAVSLPLILLLALQSVHHERARLSQFPEARPLIDLVCRAVPCPRTTVEARAPEAFRMEGRSVISHPEVSNALMVTADLINGGEIAQPPPVVELRFTDVNGRTVAMRRFSPEEYGMGETPLTPGQQIYLRLELVDPGRRAIAYEFAFL